MGRDEVNTMGCSLWLMGLVVVGESGKKSGSGYVQDRSLSPDS